MFATSVVIHALAVVGLVVYRMVAPTSVVAADAPVMIQFLQPSLPEPELLDSPVEEPIDPPIVVPPVVDEPEPLEEAIPTPPPPPPEPIEEPPAASEPERPPDPEPPPQVRTNVFASDTAPLPERTVPEADVRTGLFGAADGAGRGVVGCPAVFAAPRTGAFDTVASMRAGTPTRDAGRSVSVAGFGGAPASGAATAARTRDRASVKRGAFERVAPGPAATKPEPKPTVEEVVEIVSKPTPVYTDEARALRLEGEVVLEVLFAAGGRLSVLRVVKGLGHGLDEAAIRAAEGIRFKPARRDGRAIDHVATLRVVFQLA